MDEIVTGRVLKSQTHDVPVPIQSSLEIADDHKINEWVLNHLPLTEDQKRGLLLSVIREKKSKCQSEVQLSRAQKKKELYRSKKIVRQGIKTRVPVFVDEKGFYGARDFKDNSESTEPQESNVFSGSESRTSTSSSISSTQVSQQQASQGSSDRGE